jgi:hypothetical protein
MTDILSPIEIAQWLRDMGRLSHGEAHRLEQRIFAWANLQRAEGRKDGILEAARKAKYVVAGIKVAGQRAAALKPLRAVERLLPQGDDARQEAYARGYQDGAADERRKGWTKRPEKNE